MKHIEIAEQRVVGGWLRLLKICLVGIFFFKYDCFYLQFISDEKTNDSIVLNNTKSSEKSLSNLFPETIESAPNKVF